MAKRKHTYTDEELEKVINTTGLTDLISESESEGEFDELEADVLYDSDSDVEYTPIPGEDSSDEDDGEEVCGDKRKKQKKKGGSVRYTVCTTVCDISSLGSAAHSPGTSFANSNGALVRCVECPSKSD